MVASKSKLLSKSSLTRTKSASEARFFISFEYKTNTVILLVCIKYSMHVT